MLKQIIKFNIIFLISLLMVLFIWFRFIRERLPKDIPLQLTEVSTLFLILIIILYFISIILQSKDPEESTNLKGLLSIIYKPFKGILEYITQFTGFITNSFEAIIISLKNSNIIQTCIYTILIPRLILVMVFLIDTFYFKQFHYIYAIALISFPILLGLIIRVFCKFTLSKNLEGIDKQYQLVVWDTTQQQPMYITSEWLSLAQANRYLKGNIYIHYDLVIRMEFVNELVETIHKAHPETINNKKMRIHHYYDMDELKNNVRAYLNLAVLIQVILIQFNKFNEKYKHVLLAITMLYFIGWLYVFMLSLHTVKTLPYLSMIKDIIEPFSGLSL